MVNGLQPSEFWQMHPRQFWWFYEAKTLSIESPDDKWADLYAMLEE